jgi:hypothetical protein
MARGGKVPVKGRPSCLIEPSPLERRVRGKEKDMVLAVATGCALRNASPSPEFSPIKGEETRE